MTRLARKLLQLAGEKMALQKFQGVADNLMGAWVIVENIDVLLDSLHPQARYP
jgi:hypothetical protein